MTKLLEINWICIDWRYNLLISWYDSQQDPIRWPVFWGCAAGALGIIIYRKWMRKKI